jgi:hypothetical protein
MAYTPGTGSYAQGDLSIREDLSDQIADIDVLETRVSSSSSTVKVTNKIHSWVLDPIDVVSSQVGTPEFADTTFIGTNPTTALNVTQIIEYGVAVSGTDSNSDHAGFTDKFAREKLKKMKTWKNQLEYSAVAGAAATASGTGQRKMAGIASYASTSTGHSSVTLNPDMLNFFIRVGYDLGAKFDNILASSTMKQRISSFTSPNTRNVDASSGTVVYRVDVYDSDFGRLEIHPHQYVNKITNQTQNGIVLYQSDVVRIGVMDPVHYEDRARTGYYQAGAIVGEYTVEVGNGKGVAYIYGLL